MNTNDSSKSDVLFTEVPASWNTRYVSPEGFECQFTLRGETGQELLERASGVITHLLNAGCKPYSYNKTALLQRHTTAEQMGPMTTTVRTGALSINAP